MHKIGFCALPAVNSTLPGVRTSTVCQGNFFWHLVSPQYLNSKKSRVFFVLHSQSEKRIQRFSAATCKKGVVLESGVCEVLNIYPMAVIGCSPTISYRTNSRSSWLNFQRVVSFSASAVDGSKNPTKIPFFTCSFPFGGRDLWTSVLRNQDRGEALFPERQHGVDVPQQVPHLIHQHLHLLVLLPYLLQDNKNVVRKKSVDKPPHKLKQ